MASTGRNELVIKIAASAEETSRRQALLDAYQNCPIPLGERLDNLGLFLKRQSLSRILWMHELYQKILPVHGIVIEFGVRWGQNLALFESFRGMYEPYNYNRKIVGFDTFAGFAAISPQDGSDAAVVAGADGVTENYQEYLEALLAYHESESPIAHLKKFELIRGDAPRKLKEYLDAHPETIVALAYFDFDLYEPTKACLELIRDRLTRGSVLGFDELNSAAFPGETIALREALGLTRYAIRRFTPNPCPSYVVID